MHQVSRVVGALLSYTLALTGCGADGPPGRDGPDAAVSDGALADAMLLDGDRDAASDGSDAAIGDGGTIDDGGRDAARPDGATAMGGSLRFFGNGRDDIDRVKIAIDDPATTAPGPPADVGATDFTIEFFVRGRRDENRAEAIACTDYDWIRGNIVIDRDRYEQPRSFGVSIAGGRVAFGLNTEQGARTICGSSDVLDDAWHHVAVARRRSDGRMWLFVDGELQAERDGPDGDLSYPDDGVPGDFCGGPCTFSDPFLVIGAEKHDAGPAYPSFRGWVDEIRLSTSLRYGPGGFSVPTRPFVPDRDTAALYHLDEGEGDIVHDALGRSHGVRRFGGSPAGPVWSTESPF